MTMHNLSSNLKPQALWDICNFLTTVLAKTNQFLFVFQEHNNQMKMSNITFFIIFDRFVNDSFVIIRKSSSFFMMISSKKAKKSKIGLLAFSRKLPVSTGFCYECQLCTIKLNIIITNQKCLRMGFIVAFTVCFIILYIQNLQPPPDFSGNHGNHKY